MQTIAPLPPRKPRIEIIPLIDIMFFLLASFMLVSLTMIRLQGLHVSLPGIVPPGRNAPADDALTLKVAANADGTSRFTLAGQPMTAEALVEALRKRMAADGAEARETRLFISVDRGARHANLIEALDRVKQGGLQRFGFSLRPGSDAGPAPSAPQATIPPR